MTEKFLALWRLIRDFIKAFNVFTKPKGEPIEVPPRGRRRERRRRRREQG